MTVTREAALWLLAVAMGATAIQRSARNPEEEPQTRVIPMVPDVVGRSASLAKDDAETIVAHNLFRLDRRPPEMARAGASPMQAAAMPTPPPLVVPNLVLRGVVGGPPWQALLDGLPGRTGPTVVRQGDRIGDIVIRLVQRDSIVVGISDSTWRLGIVRAWR